MADVNLRWFTALDGTRTLQCETGFGWEDVPEVTEADENARALQQQEEYALHMQREAKEAQLRGMAPLARRAMKDFDVVSDVVSDAVFGVADASYHPQPLKGKA